MSPAARGATLLAIVLLIPACNITFTSGDDPFAAPQSAPQNPFALQIPLDGATGVLTYNTQFAWGALPGAQSYRLQISLTAGFAQVLVDLPNLPNPWVFSQAGLTNSTNYYWRVFASINGSTQIAGGSPYRFTTISPAFLGPGAFFLQAPVGGIITPTLSPPLVWTVSQGAAIYSLQIDTTLFFSTPVVDLPNLHLNIVDCPIVLAPQTTYYWRVTATNSFGSITSSPPAAMFITP